MYNCQMMMELQEVIVDKIIVIEIELILKKKSFGYIHSLLFQNKFTSSFYFRWKISELLK